MSGRKALLLVQRDEAAQALAQIDAPRTQQLQNRIMQWQFFTDFFNFTAWSLRLSGVELLLSVKEIAMKHDHFVVQSPDKPAQQLLLLFHGVGDNPVAMGEIGSGLHRCSPMR